MKREQWPNKIFYLVVCLLLGVGIFIFGSELVRATIASPVLFSSPRFVSAEEKEWIALFICQEVEKNAQEVKIVSPPSTDLDSWKVKATIDGEEEKNRLFQSMDAISRVLADFGFYGEKREKGDKVYFYLFWKLDPWFVLEAEILPQYKVAIVIDDLGYNLDQARPFLEFPAKLNLSIFPHLPLSSQIASLAAENGKEVLIHFPMEALDSTQNQAETFLLRVGMAEEKVEQMLEQAFSQIPQAVGVNNHKGSKATEDVVLMETFLGLLKEKNCYFLDSLTSGGSVAFEVAQNQNLCSFKRDIFLDGILTEDYIIGQLNKAFQLSKEKGQAIAIGHANSVTFQALNKFLSSWDDPQVGLVFLSEMALSPTN
ncbi:MAG: uncharacterized protein PWP04_537 [Candidatus Atribacteria bacterium]|nr:uncharacterized protein [Candidatus Atribacteria bacterium]